MADDLGRLLEDGGFTTAEVRRKMAQMFPPSWFAPGQPEQLPPLPDRRGEIRNLPARPKAEVQEKIAEGLTTWGLGPMAWEAGKGAIAASKPTGSWAKFFDEHGVDLASLLVPAPGRRARMREMPRTLEEYVDNLKAPRDGKPPLFDYDEYLRNPTMTVNARAHNFESQEPAYKGKKAQDPPREAKNLSHWRTLDDLRDKRDAGMLLGPDGTPVNPWYWPAPLYKAFRQELGDDLAHQRLSKLFSYNAATSPITRVPRNIIEGWMLLHHDLNGLPFNKLWASELTGAAFKNKLKMAGDVGEGQGLEGGTKHKVRNFDMNLHGSGVAEPSYRFEPGGAMERILTPVTLDSIMAEAMRLRKNAKSGGEPSERFRGPMYREGMKVVHGLGDEIGAAGADTQAAIWQQHQLKKYTDPIYNDSYARIFDDVVNRVARHYEQDPKKTLADMIHGKGKGPPNSFANGSLGALAPLIPPGMMLDYYYNQPEPALHQ